MTRRPPRSSGGGAPPTVPHVVAPAVGRTRRLPGVGIGLGLTAAGITALAGFAADRLNRERRLALALDEQFLDDPFRVVPDEERTVVARDGVRLHVEIDDPGAQAGRPTVVLSHGYCLSSRSWVFQRRALREAGHRVVVWDQRGHGRSGGGDAASYDLDRLGDDLAAVLDDAAPTGPLVLVGHSMGGMTMMSFALERPEVVADRVVGAAFVSTSPGGLDEVSYGLGAIAGRAVHRLGPTTTTALASHQGFVDAAVRGGRDLVDALVAWGSFASPVPMSVARLTSQMIFGTRMEVISAFLPGFDTLDQREALAAFDGIETLVISGMQDRLTPPGHSEEIVRLVPGAEHVVVGDAGHVIMLEHPDIVTEHLLDLVGRAERATPVRRRSVRRTVTDVGSRRRASAGRRVRPAPGRRSARGPGGSR